MAGRNREPVALIRAKGKSHFSKAELEEREARELKVPYTDVQPPDFLVGKHARDEFMRYASMLLDLGIFTELDEDCLGRYILSKTLYLKYTSLLTKLINQEKLDQLPKIQTLQSQAFRQCHTCASALGLTITSRCKLTIPNYEDEEDYEL